MSRKIKILIVDDEPQNVQILEEILSFHPKYEYFAAQSGEQALEMVEHIYPDLILLDLMMPGIDGYDVCKKIRTLEHCKYSKILIISGKTLVADRIRGYNVRADDYLTKPFVEDELIAKLEVYSKLAHMEEVDTLKTMALNILSHETRTPLNGILLGSELLREVPGLPEEAIEYAGMIEASGSRIKRLIEKINRYCEVKGGIVSRQKEVNLIDLYENIRAMASQRPDIEFDLHLDDSTAKIDGELLLEIMGYLIENAVKYTRYDGKIKLTVTKNDDVLRLKLDDQGCGIDSAVEKQIFDGLFNSDVLHHSEGTGLSLAITKQIVTALKGSISCGKNEDKGARFVVELPVE